jgi:PAS domain S-box-containing protein
VTVDRRAEGGESTPLAPEQADRLSLDLLAAAPVVLYAIEVRGEVGRGLWASDSLSRVVGWSREEALAPGWWYRNLHPLDIERVTRFYRERRNEDRLVCTYRFRHRDGHYLALRDERLQQRDEADGALVAYGIWLDVSEQARAETAARDLAAELRTLLETEPECVKVVDERGRLIEMNAAGLAMLEAESVDQVLGKSVLDWVAPEHRPAFEAFWHRTLAGERGTFRFEARGLRGGRRWLETRSALLPVEEGMPRRVVAVTRDVSEAVRREEELRRVAADYRLLFESSPLPMWIFDAATLRFLAVNEAAVRRYGYTREEFLARTIRDIRPPEELDRLAANLAARGPGLEDSGPWLHQWKDGSVRTVEIYSHTLEWEGRPGELVLVHDVTARLAAERALRATQEQLLHAQKMEAIGRLAGGIAHDLNNLLTVIQGHGELAADVLPVDSAATESIREMMRATERAAGLTRQLLAVARRQVLEERLFDLNAVVEQLSGMLRRLLGEDLTLSLDLASDLGMVRADPAQLEQVVMNLALNARDAMPRGGKLRLVSRNRTFAEGDETPRGLPPGRYVELAVEDSGEGIAAEVLDRIFEPFFTTKAADKGTGLGLSTAYGIVRQSGGTIEVASRPGRGSRFAVLLPRSDDEAEVVRPAFRRGAAAGGSESVLLVEDEPALRAIVRRVLESAGYNVLDAPNGADALALFEADPQAFDLLLSDVVMPGMRGTELARRLLAAMPDLRVLLVTGYAEEDVSEVPELAGRVALLAKPFSNHALLAKLREILDRRDDEPAAAR